MVCGCGRPDRWRKLTAHHLYNKHDHPELAGIVFNGVPLCCKCHELFHRLYQGKTTPVDMMTYIFLIHQRFSPALKQVLIQQLHLYWYRLSLLMDMPTSSLVHLSHSFTF